MNTNDALNSDFIVIGGGSAGCVLAARLSEDPGCRVTLVEAGGSGRGTLIDVPAALVAMLPTAIHNWRFKTVPQAGLQGRRGYAPRGRALGGSSAINAMVYMRGHRSDYDRWAALGNPGWSYEELLPWFRRAEHNEVFEDGFHGRGGPLNVAPVRTDNPFLERFVQAGTEAGYRRNADFNGAEQEGFGVHQVTQKGGERWSAFRAYLEPVLNRPNLRVLRKAMAERLLFDGNRCTGVEVRQGGRLLRLQASAEVIVSAGSYQSPQLLMCSGVGHPGDLAEHGITVRHALPGVGRNLHDHIDFIFGYQVPSTDLLGVSAAGTRRIWQELKRWRHQRRGFFASNYAEAGAFIRRRPDSPAPEYQLMFVPAVVDDHARRLTLAHGFSCHLVLLRPKSRGTVTLAGPSMHTAPRIDPQYFGHAEDLADMIEGFKITRRVLQQPSLAAHTTRELFSAGVETDAQIRDLLRQRCDTVYHPVGTCRMGPRGDSGAVVDAQLRVHGLAGLRVVDASVMPSIVGGNTNAPTIAVAEKAADLIRAAHRGSSVAVLAARTEETA